MSKIIVSLLLFFSQFIAHSTPPVINDYDSTIVINKNSSIVVRETINVSTDGVEIQHGIYRDLPTRYKTIQGFHYDLGFKLISVRRDNRPEEYHIQQLSNGIRIYIGSSKSYLPPSTYTYEITYSINGALAFFANDDELYWNVTGNAWVFPILKASATVLLPQKTKISKMTAYTGAQQAREKNYHQALLQANEAFFTTEQKLAPNQGLTIVVAWPKGIITPPTLLLKIKNFIKDNHSLAFAFMGYVILIIFYILSWFYLGQDPQSKVIIPLFEPPAGFSPQSLGYIKEMESSDKLFTAAIINMAVKKYLMIEETSKKEYRLKKIAADENNLTASEKAISQELFKNTPSILMVQANHSPISKAVEQFNEKLAEEFQKQYFILNTPIILLGIAISVVSLLPLLGPLLFHSFDSLFVFCIVGFYGFFFIESLIPHKIKRFQRFYLSVLSIILLIIILGIIFLPLIFDSLFGSNWLIYLLTALFITTNSLFRDLMRRPTPKGMDIVSQTLGFELFLKATEETQMNFRNPPDKTPQLFERYLPFALALGIEQSWSEQFSQILSKSQYKPEWYSSRLPNFSSSHFSQSLGNSFTSAVCSARVAPSSSSSSGFGSGGFSGGGFGGGGGGGW